MSYARFQVPHACCRCAALFSISAQAGVSRFTLPLEALSLLSARRKLQLRSLPFDFLRVIEAPSLIIR